MNPNRGSSLERAATKLLNSYNKFEQLKELGNRKNYPNKLIKLEERLSSEIALWKRKGPSAKLTDLQKDLDFVEKQKNELFFDKEKIDLLANKYSIGYGENRNTQ